MEALMIKLITLALVLLTAAATLPAQTPEITPETPVTSAQLIQWLHSGNPRLIAWSATLASRNHDIATITQMPGLLQTRSIFKGSAEQRLAISAILDTLIVEQTPVNLPTIKAIATNFPVQAAILINRLPLHESQSTLREWTHGTTGGSWDSRLLARVSAMMLAQDSHPEPEFIAEIVAAAEESLQISVTSGAHSESNGIGPACGDSLGHPLAAGWPPVYIYDLVENDSNAGLTRLVELDGDRITYRRHKENEGYGSCNGVEYLDPTTRHRLIAHWLGVRPNDMPWHPVEFVTIVWTNMTDYQQQLGATIESHRAQLKATYDTLYQRGLLRPGVVQALSTDQGLPKLTVTISCTSNPCPIETKK